MDVELRQLRVFLTVASELHFSRAAARLHISQPALSQQIRTLEKALGTPLFDRTSRATELTPAGRVLLDAAPRVLFEADRARTRVAQAAEGASGLLVVGSVGTALASIAPQILRTLRTRFPDLQLQVSQHDTAAQLVALAEERLDVGLVRAAAATATVAVEMLVAEPLLVALPADHVLAGRDTVDPADLAGEPFVLWPRPLGTDFFDIIVGYCRDHGFSPRIVAEGPDIETQLSLVAAGIGVSLQPSYYANLRPPGVEFRPLSGTVPTVALQVAWRRRDRSPAVRHFLDAARASAGTREISTRRAPAGTLVGVTEHEVFAVRYGRLATRASAAYLNWQVYDEPDVAFGMDYYFWVLRSGGRTTLVDCGFDAEVGRRRGRELLVDPLDALRAMGVGSVDRVVVSHAHYDHIGNLARLPGEPEIVITRRELEFWLGPYARRPQFAHVVEDDEIAVLARAHADGRVTTFDDRLVTDDGLDLLEVGGHTPGQLVATVAVPGGEAVLATDALHFYDELTRDRPFFVVADLAAMYAGFDTLGDLARPSHRVLVAGHDADVARRFPARAEGTGIDDLVIRIDAAPR